MEIRTRGISNLCRSSPHKFSILVCNSRAVNKMSLRIDTHQIFRSFYVGCRCSRLLECVGACVRPREYVLPFSHILGNFTQVSLKLDCTELSQLPEGPVGYDSVTTSQHNYRIITVPPPDQDGRTHRCCVILRLGWKCRPTWETRQQQPSTGLLASGDHCL